MSTTEIPDGAVHESPMSFGAKRFTDAMTTTKFAAPPKEN
jgi:hypothetical protein